MYARQNTTNRITLTNALKTWRVYLQHVVKLTSSRNRPHNPHISNSCRYPWIYTYTEITKNVPLDSSQCCSVPRHVSRLVSSRDTISCLVSYLNCVMTQCIMSYLVSRTHVLCNFLRHPVSSTKFI